MTATPPRPASDDPERKPEPAAVNAFASIASMLGARLARRRITMLLLIVAAAPAIVLAVRSDGVETASFHLWVAALLLALGVPLIGVLTSTSALGEERFGHTLGFLLVKPIPRSVIAAAGLVAAWAVAMAISGAGIGAAWAVSSVRSGEGGIGWPAVVAAAVTLAGYAAVFVPLGLLARQGTLVGLGFILIWEGIITGAGATLATASLWRTGLSAYLALADGAPAELREPLGNLTPGAGGAIAKVAVMLALSLALTTWLLSRRDLVRE